jgi:hypothetical protein
MDLNYLFYRQQIERSRADAASSDEARKAHERLAAGYEAKISEAAISGQSADDRPTFFVGFDKVNATLAVAMTAREVDDG